MEKWQRVWRFGIRPFLSDQALIVLVRALETNDLRLMQGRICSPPPLDELADCAVLGCCSIGFAGWQGEGLTTVGEVERFFHRICDHADTALGEPAACRHFLNWYDETPRSIMRRRLLAEVRLALSQAPLAA
ncbi:MAG: hypothetical protein HYX68_14755 [Planctomycetes bacterium]|jgi:hypothetical protein|nr:hypothetical protein [Planctomycetota bacterium]